MHAPAKSLHVQSIGGASGDMILGALIDLGVDAACLEKALQTLNIGPFILETSSFGSHGLHGCRVQVRVPEADTSSHPHRHLSHIIGFSAKSVGRFRLR